MVGWQLLKWILTCRPLSGWGFTSTEQDLGLGVNLTRSGLVIINLGYQTVDLEPTKSHHLWLSWLGYFLEG